MAYSAFTGVNLTGSFTAPDLPDAGGETITDINIARRAWQHVTMDVPDGLSKLTVEISGGTGDADLYVRYGTAPSTSSYTCRPYLNGNNEVCTINNPQAGTWHVGIRAYTAFSGVTFSYQY